MTRKGPSEARRAVSQAPPSPIASGAEKGAGEASRASQEALANDVQLARQTLQAICQDLSAPASARAQAARTLAEMAGALSGRERTGVKPAAEMTAAELDAALAQAQAGERA